jgi:UrcA family protein
VQNRLPASFNQLLDAVMIAASIAREESMMNAAVSSRSGISMPRAARWIAAVLAGFAACAGALAADDVPQLVLRAKSATLENPTRASALYDRIGIAARRVCSAHRGRTLVAHQNYRECVDDAIDRAVVRTNHPLLTSIHGRATDSDDVIRTAETKSQRR